MDSEGSKRGEQRGAVPHATEESAPADRRALFGQLNRQLMEQLESSRNRRRRRRAGRWLVLVVVVLATAGITVFLVEQRPWRSVLARRSSAEGKPAASIPAVRPKAPPALKTPPAPKTAPAPVAMPVAQPPPQSPAAKPAPVAAVTSAATGRLRLKVTPPVTVMLGERELGRTPFTVEVPAGVHQLLLVEPKLGIRLKRKVWIKAADLAVFTWQLGMGKLVVRCPTPVQIWVGGMVRGSAPAEIELPGGSHTVRLGSRSGPAHRVRIHPGKTKHLECPAAKPKPPKPGPTAHNRDEPSP